MRVFLAIADVPAARRLTLGIDSRLSQRSPSQRSLSAAFAIAAVAATLGMEILSCGLLGLAWCRGKAGVGAQASPESRRQRSECVKRFPSLFHLRRWRHRTCGLACSQSSQRLPSNVCQQEKILASALEA